MEKSCFCLYEVLLVTSVHDSEYNMLPLKSTQNGTPRSLRAALWRFAELAHLVRPQKCRYVLSSR